MRYIRFIAAFIAIFATTSCFVDDIEQVEVPSEGRDDVTVVARVARFDDREVDTRGTKNDAEANVTCMAVAIFPIVDDANGDDAIGDCVFYDFREGNQLLFTINRQETKGGAYIYNVDKPYVMYVFANLPTMTEGNCANMTLDQMKAMAYSVNSGVGIPEKGFPMVGSLGDTITPEGDGKTFILKPTSATNPTLPLVNGDESDLLNVPMKAMFSKVNFTIKVTPDQTVDTHLTPQFTLKSYTVHNVPASVDFAMGGKPRLNHSVTDDVTSVIGPFKDPMPLLNDIKFARGTQTINFTFYLPERFLTPTYQSHDGSKDGQDGYYNYPFPVVGGKYRAEDLDLRQRFKPLLPDGQAATYVTINGTFRDHQQHEFNVTYDVYLGEDNYGNFDTERNCEYFHYVTIRGILNSDDQVNYGPNEMPVSIDHRVNVTRVEPIIINLRRETLLDSHFEVRPLRIRENPDYTGDLSKAKVKVEVVYDKTTTQKWVGLERSFGNGAQSGSSTYLVATDLAADRQNSKGKRKYFTTDLTTNTLSKAIGTLDANGYSTEGGQSVIVPVTAEDEAVWIYVDEALVAEAGDAIRKATIRVSVAEDGSNYGAPIDYVIQQRQLFPVKYVDDNGTPNNKTDDKTYEYLIEYEEEYLHNFDADDSYGQTDFEGMQWGANNIQLSSKYPAVYVDITGGIMDWLEEIGVKLTQVTNNLISNVKPYYDFYLSRDVEKLQLPIDDNINDNNWNGVVVRNHSGYEFTDQIMTRLRTENAISSGTLSSTPLSAVEYCYSKNKTDVNGNVTNMEWYLPAIDEIEEIVYSKYGSNNDQHNTYSRFIEFQNKKYWSSQPAYIQGTLAVTIRGYFLSYGTASGKLFEDNIGDVKYGDPGSARATSILYTNGQYSPISSGLSGPAFNTAVTYRYENIYSGPTRTNITPAPTPDDGYLPRTSYARVRCVRKAN